MINHKELIHATLAKVKRSAKISLYAKKIMHPTIENQNMFTMARKKVVFTPIRQEDVHQTITSNCRLD